MNTVQHTCQLLPGSRHARPYAVLDLPGTHEWQRPKPCSLGSFRTDILEGLFAPQKRIDSKYLYDARGSEIFEEICDVPEYYPARAETRLLADFSAAIAARLPSNARLIELGSGASAKTRLLLDEAAHITHYTAIDISQDALDRACASLVAAYPGLEIRPRMRDFSVPGALQGSSPGFGSLLFLPGSTLGNFAPDVAGKLMSGWADECGDGALFLVGMDLVKDIATLVRAYDDADGVTARFNLNLLARLNRELDASFDLETFEHRAVWNAQLSRIEMHLVSLRDQFVDVAGARLRFGRMETIHTESSYKYRAEEFVALAESSGWAFEECRISEGPEFGLFLFRRR